MNGGRGAVVRGGLSVMLVLGVALVGVVGIGVVSPGPASAEQATGGGARFTSADWISWGDAEEPIASGTSRTSTTRVGDEELAVTCTASNVVGDLVAYRSGTWRGDGFDDLYNIGGTDGDNQMVVGMANRTNGATVTFDFACTATLGGQPFPLAGLVIADAEASGGVEHVGATAPAGSTWRIIDRVRGGTCALDTYAYRPSTSPERLQLYGPAANTCEGTDASQRPGPSAIAFLDGATSLSQVTVRGLGRSAIAVGYVIDVDFGDAPESYGAAGAALQVTYAGGEVTTTDGAWSATNRGVPVFGSIPLATTGQPTTRLGAAVDAEPAPLHSAAADGDDLTGVPDEDAFTTPPEPVVLEPGGTYAIDVPCAGPAVVGGWIDFDGDGAFGDDERSTTTPACTGGAVRLTWDVPADLLPEAGTLETFLRLRATGPGEPMRPVGMSAAGEVEDHAITLATGPRLRVGKIVEGRIDPSDQFTVSADGAGVDGTLAVTTTGSATRSESAPVTVTAGGPVEIGEAVAAGSASALDDYDATLACVDRAADDQVVPSEATGSGWAVEDLRPGQDVICRVTNVPAPRETTPPGTPRDPESPVGVLPSTGAGPLAGLLGVGVVLAVLGGFALRRSRRRAGP